MKEKLVDLVMIGAAAYFFGAAVYFKSKHESAHGRHCPGPGVLCYTWAELSGASGALCHCLLASDALPRLQRPSIPGPARASRRQPCNSASSSERPAQTI